MDLMIGQFIHAVGGKERGKGGGLSVEIVILASWEYNFIWGTWKFGAMNTVIVSDSLWRNKKN